MRTPFLLLALLFLQSCTLVVFKKPLPIGEDNIDSFPVVYQGKYLHDSDTLEICEKSVKVYDDSISEYFLSDTLIVRKQGDAYYINYGLDDMWLVFKMKFYNTDSLRVEACEPIVSKGNDEHDKDVEEAINGLKKITRVKGKDGYIILNPRKKHVDRIFDSEFYGDYMTLKKIK